MEMVQNTKDTEQRIKDIAEVLDIDKDYITYDEEEQVYLISKLQELEKLEIKKEVDFSQLRNFPLKFTKCHFSQDLLVNEQEFKEKLIFENVVFSKSINFSRNTFYREVGFFGCEFKNKLYPAQCVFQDKVRVFGVNLLSIDCQDSIFKKEVCFGRERNDPNLEKGFHFGSYSFKDGNFLNCQFHDNVYFKNNEFDCAAAFQNARFYSNAYFNNSTFKDSADFHECEFEKTACFYGVKFDKVPNFSQAQFKGSLNVVNTNLDFGFESLKEKIEQEHKQQNPNSKKSLAHFANDFRDSFRVFKNALIKDNNLLDASNFHKYELYCKEIELDSKETKTLKDKVEKWQLWFYRKLCDHHTDLVLNLKWLIIAIGLFACLYFIAKVFQNINILNILSPLGVFLSILSFLILFCMCYCKCIKIFDFFAYLSVIPTLWVICYKPKLIFGIANLVGNKNYNGFENALITIYTILLALVLFSLQKTARKNSIVPN